MPGLKVESAEETGRKLALRLRAARLAKGVTQEALSAVSGVSLGSVKRFESTGQASLEAVIRMANALNRGGEIRELFTAPETVKRKETRGRKKKIPPEEQADAGDIGQAPGTGET